MTEKTQAHEYRQEHAGGFEIAISKRDLAIKGGCQIFEGHSTTGHQEVPEIELPRRQVDTNGIIQWDQHWYLEFFWIVYGALACLLDCGYWQTKVFFEQMGGGETHFSPEIFTQDIGVSGHRYQSRVHIKPHDLKPGIYRVVACLQFCFKDGSPGPIVGFYDKGVIKIFEDKRIAKPYSAENDLAVTKAVE